MDPEEDKGKKRKFSQEILGHSKYDLVLISIFNIILNLKYYSVRYDNCFVVFFFFRKIALNSENIEEVFFFLLNL